MKKRILSMFLLAIPMLTFAQEKGLDQQIDKAFGDATGWFVNLIFYQIPFTDTISIYWVDNLNPIRWLNIDTPQLETEQSLLIYNITVYIFLKRTIWNYIN